MDERGNLDLTSFGAQILRARIVSERVASCKYLTAIVFDKDGGLGYRSLTKR